MRIWEISQENDNLQLEIYATEKKKWWNLSLDEFQNALIFAKNYLQGKKI